MIRPRLLALCCALPAATFVAGCGAQMGGGAADRRFEDLRGLVLEQRRAIEDLRREQESLRASLDQMQYGRRAAARPAYGPAGATEDGYWRKPIPPSLQPAEYGAAVPGAPVPGAPATDPRYATPGAAPTTGVPVPVPADATAALPPAPAEQPVVPASGSVPTELVGSSYDSAMRQLSSGDHDEAIQSFRNYLHENGSAAYADDAQYWIGEAYFRKGQYHRAIIELNQVAINYGSGDRAPSALLRQAEAFRIVGDRVDARLSLQKIINRYPGTQEAAKASRMLSEIGG